MTHCKGSTAFAGRQQVFAVRVQPATLYLYADDPVAIRMYLKASFEPPDPPLTWCWAAKD